MDPTGDSIKKLETDIEEVKRLLKRARQNTEELQNMLHVIEIVLIKLHEDRNGNSG